MAGYGVKKKEQNDIISKLCSAGYATNNYCSLYNSEAFSLRVQYLFCDILHIFETLPLVALTTHEASSQHNTTQHVPSPPHPWPLRSPLST